MNIVILTNNVIISKPQGFSVSRDYLNKPKSRIDFRVPYDGKVNIKIYDVLGRETASPIDKNHSADLCTIVFDCTNLASGVYFYRIIADDNAEQNFSKTMEMLIIK